MEDLRAARKKAGLTLKQVASVFGFSHEWLRKIEIGRLPITPEREAEIVQVISRLSSLTARVNGSVATGLQKIRARVQAPAQKFKNPKI
jgi:transcriptional regulator with XRE-family HTH domain